MLNNQNLTTFFSWFKKGSFAVIDQVLFAGTNFLVGILLARWLNPVSYGAFSTAYAVFLFVGTIHTALWTEPMLVYGSGRFREKYQIYQKVLLFYHWRLGLGISVFFIILSTVFFFYGQPELGRSGIGLAVSSPLILYLWLMRRSAYVLLAPQFAVYGGLVYLILYLGFSVVLYKYDVLNEATSLICMGGSGLISGLLVHSGLKFQKDIFLPKDRSISKDVKKNHWDYGKWALLAGAFSWSLLNLYFVILPITHGLTDSASLKALINFIQPVLVFNNALVILFIPMYVDAIKTNTLSQKVKNSSMVIFLNSVAFCIFLIIFGQRLTQYIYSNRYIFPPAIFVFVGLIPVVSSVTNIFAAIYRAEERPREIAYANFFAALFSIFIGIPLTYQFSYYGSIVSVLIAHVLIIIYLIVKKTNP